MKPPLGTTATSNPGTSNPGTSNPGTSNPGTSTYYEYLASTSAFGGQFFYHFQISTDLALFFLGPCASQRAHVSVTAYRTY